MQLVFVHGVNTRRDPVGKYDADVEYRHKCFRDWTLNGADVAFHDPYWGDLGAHPDKGLISIPKGPGVAFGGLGAANDITNIEASLDGDVLLRAAREDFGAVLNTLALREAQSGELGGDEIAQSLAAYAADYDDMDSPGLSTPAWLDAVDSDEEFLDRLEVEIGGSQNEVGMGLGNRLKKAGKWIVGGIIDLVDGPAEKLVRKTTPAIAQFLGDVFIYLKQDSRRDQIRSRVSSSIVAAAKAAESEQKLVVIGHSMGAIILYDMMNNPQLVSEMEAKIGSSLKIDLFLTVGTQIGLFEELDLFTHSQPGVTPGKPPSASLWWHVYNVMDVLSFGVEGVIDDAIQFSVNTKANIVDAHGAYFISPVFHKRLRKRLEKSGLLG